MRRPLIAVGCCFWEGSFIHASKHGAGDKYIRAVTEYAGVIPMLVPALEELYALQTSGPGWVDSVLSPMSGLMLTGSPSNIHPSRYGVEPTESHPPYDTRRDAVTFQLIEGALKRKMPILGVCRGFQELNVYFGGTLETNINTEQCYHGFPTDIVKNPNIDEKSMEYQDIKYGPAHAIKMAPGSYFHNLLQKDETQVNSCHYQGIGTLASNLSADAVAPDGRVEAFSCMDGDQFILAVQWHPEYKPAGNEDSQQIYKAFGSACEKYMSKENVI